MKIIKTKILYYHIPIYAIAVYCVHIIKNLDKMLEYYNCNKYILYNIYYIYTICN